MLIGGRQSLLQGPAQLLGTLTFWARDPIQNSFCFYLPLLPTHPFPLRAAPLGFHYFKAPWTRCRLNMPLAQSSIIIIINLLSI